jgi:hypothetical protein
MTQFNILNTPQIDDRNANGTIYIPNPSVMTLYLGNVTMNMSVNGTMIGVSTIEDLVLKPGDNNVNMHAVTNNTAVGLLLFTDYKCGIFPIDIVGNNSTYNGKDLPYYDQALHENKLRINLDVIDALQRAGLADALGLNGTRSACANT